MNKHLMYMLLGALAIVVPTATLYTVLYFFTWMVGAQNTLMIFAGLLIFTTAATAIWALGYFISASIAYNRNEAARKEYRKSMGYGL